MKFRKKPVVIDAYQTDKEMIIHTLEGDMKANVGDWIITDLRGEQYPCKPGIFEKSYEKVEEDEKARRLYTLKVKDNGKKIIFDSVNCGFTGPDLVTFLEMKKTDLLRQFAIAEVKFERFYVDKDGNKLKIEEEEE